VIPRDDLWLRGIVAAAALLAIAFLVASGGTA
jgi:hypothetical protein